MANFSALKTAIQNAIKQNGNEEITGDVLQQILLSIVSTMGDGSINTIEQNLSQETLARQNGDNTLQSNINAEALARGNADTQLQNAINAIKANIDNGYVYAGIATPSSTPVSGKVFYIATAAGTYTNFGGQVLTQGINILRFNGSAWSSQQLIGIDDVPTAGSNNFVKSGGVQNEFALGAVYDVSAKNPTAGPNSDGKWESLSALLSDANLNTLIPTAYRKGGMSIKFVHTSDNKYVQYRFMLSTFTAFQFTKEANWQSMNVGKIIPGSGDIAKSESTYYAIGDYTKNIIENGIFSLKCKSEHNSTRKFAYCIGIGELKFTVSSFTSGVVNIYGYTDKELETSILLVRALSISATPSISNISVENNLYGFGIYFSSSFPDNYETNIEIEEVSISDKIKELKALINGDDIFIADLNPTWNTGGYYLSDSIELQEGRGFYTSALDISDYAGKTVVFIVNTIAPGSSTRACIITNDNDDTILSASIEHLESSTLPTFEYDSNLQAYKVKLNIPDNAKYLRMSVSTNATERQVKIFKQGVTPTPEPERLNTIFYVDGINGNDNNDGLTSSTAFKTTAKFVETASNLENCTLIIAGGIYTSALNLTGLKGNVSIIGKNNETIIFSGSDTLTDWTAVDGYNGIYKCSSNASIPVQGQYNNGRGMIFENGRPSKPILDEERHPSQKGLSHRLPFTIIQQSLADTLTNALSDIETNGGWYSDGSYIYIKNQDGSNPSTNGYTYEYEARSVFICPNTIVKLIIRNISFRFSTLPIRFNAQFTERYNCSVFGVPGDGFVDNSNRCRSFYDECAVCGNDGANGHYNDKSGWTSDNLRNSGEFVEYYYAWMHDNGDDGMSHHEASHIRVFGGLYEYNGDGGIRLSNSCNGELHDVYARKNGQDTISSNVSGSGFDVVNGILSGDTRNGCNMLLYNCISEENNRGYAVATYNSNRLVLINCISKNNSIAELYSKAGKLIAKNCKYIQSNSNKIKVIENDGTIDIESYNDFL